MSRMYERLDLFAVNASQQAAPTVNAISWYTDPLHTHSQQEEAVKGLSNETIIVIYILGIGTS